jgi:hypothetical protein
MYDLRLHERDKKKVETIIIYSANVRKASNNLTIGSLKYTPTNVMMYEYDGNAVYTELETKLKNGQDLTDKDMINLIFLPLMRGDMPTKEAAKKSVEMAQTIKDKNKRDACIASTVACMSKYLNSYEITNILEVLKMTDIFTIALKEALTDSMTAEYLKIIKNALKKGLSLNDIADLTELDIEEIEDFKLQLEEQAN